MSLYRRSKSNWLAPKQGDKSASYWRAQARQIFARLPAVELVEIVKSGNKTDSALLARGESLPARDQYVVIASTGGKWGKSRRDYAPAR